MRELNPSSCSLTGLNLSVCRGSQFSIESTDIFSHMLFRSLYGTHGLLTIYLSINVKFSSSFGVLLFGQLLLFYAILRVFVLYSHYGDSMSSKKLNGHQAFGCMSLLGALIFLLKKHICCYCLEF